MIERKYKVTLKDTQSGDARTFEWSYNAKPEDMGYDDDVSYLWEEGNYSCDCNRSIFLWPDDEAKHLECDVGQNRIELVELEQIESEPRKCLHQLEIDRIVETYREHYPGGRAAFLVGSSLMNPPNRNGDSDRYWQLKRECEAQCQQKQIS
jgi:hypothetical protein